MTDFYEKNIILLLSLGLLFNKVNTSSTVICFLFAIVLTELSIYFHEKKVRLALGVIYLVMCLIFWQMICFAPVAIYILIENKAYYGLAGGALGILLYTNCGSIEVIISWISLFVLSALLAYENSKEKLTKQNLLNVTDASVELREKLERKNRELLENQDASIHVATLSERNRIAREIHDNVGHMLSRTILQMGALMIIYKDEPLHGQLDSINSSLNEAMNNIRESVHDLHDESFDLKQAIYNHTSEISEKLNFKFDYDMSDNIPRNVKYCFISIIKEAVSNTIKHSDANRFTLIVREHPGFFQMLIEDNGTQKINYEKAGIGLNNMKERVLGLGGNISITDSNGFKIMISIPKDR